MDELLQQVAELRGMPASLVERSAKAKADKTGTTMEAVLREWAGESSTPEAADTSPSVDAASESDEVKPDTPTEESVAVSTDYLVELAAEAKRMPPRLILTSAQARSVHSGSTLDDVLADWAGVDLEELRTRTSEAAPSDASSDAEAPPATPAEAAAPASPEPVAAAAPVAAVAATALTMDQLLEKVAEIKGMPASLVKRSAEARAKKTGEPVEAVLQEWAGVDVASVSAAPASPEPVAAAALGAATAPASTEPAAAAADEKTVGDDIEIIEAELSDTSDVSETDAEPAGTRGKYPIWLAAAFVLIPLLAVVYILVSPNGPDCGSGGQLGVDAVTGEAVNCDGSEYGVVSVDNFSAGGALYQQCVACHSDNGSGGVGPAFTAGAILATFPAGSCSDHVEWVTLGTAGWPEPTYGATDKAVGGVGLMPAFSTSLTEEQIVQVALYERVAFGGQDLEEAEADCGLVTDDASAES
jgi:mono/diheme cytochrome c family protein